MGGDSAGGRPRALRQRHRCLRLCRVHGPSLCCGGRPLGHRPDPHRARGGHEALQRRGEDPVRACDQRGDGGAADSGRVKAGAAKERRPAPGNAAGGGGGPRAASDRGCRGPAAVSAAERDQREPYVAHEPRRDTESNPSRRSCEGPQPGVMLEDLVGHMERDASGTQPSKPPCGEALATKDPDTPPLLRDVTPPRSPSCQPTTPTATSQPKLPLTCRSDGQGEQATGWSPLPRLSYAGTASEHGSRPASGSRPGTGIFDPSGRPNNPRAAEAAARAAAAVGTPVTGLNQRAAQMFYQSIEVQTGDIVWTQGELLGEGAYGKVYAGLNQHTGELMAVKVLPLNMGSGASDENKLHLQALERELGMYRKFQHRHIVGYLAAHMDFKTNTMYMFLEYVPGGSISSMLQRFGAFSEELTRKFTRELLMGLEYLHGCKVIHRDLKGGNVLVTKSGRVKLADFGASKAYHEATITDGMKSIRGSVYWMAPEVIKGTGYGRRADIWSVGCTVLEMLTATHPWPDLDNHWSAMFHIAKAKSGPPIPKNVSGLCREFLESCLQVEAHRRPTATELLQHPFVCQIPNALREAEMARGLNHSL
uniref:Mitogen-activated protein kinase kinase kinase n=1 Tax=Tetraselmis sp. GSL018 TaxID=582737 RepID=A0A061R6C7_9CHLO